MAVDARQSKLACRSHQSLLCLQQYAQTGARDVFQAAAVERDGSLDLIEKRPAGRTRARPTRPPNEAAAVRAKTNPEHCPSLRRFRGRKPTLPPAFFEM